MRSVAAIVILLAGIGIGAAQNQAAQPQGAQPQGTLQSPATSTTGVGSGPQAPTGHRQPRISDLPPELAEQEKSGAPNPSRQPTPSDPFGAVPRICRGC